MPSLLSSLTTRLTFADALGERRIGRIAPLVGLHLAALAILLWSEEWAAPMAAFVLSWGILNFFWLFLLRRPAVSAALSLALLIGLVVVSRFKFNVLWMTASFIDVMIIDADTLSFLWSMFPSVRTAVITVLVAAVPVGVLLWRLDPFRVHRGLALLGEAACFVGLIGVSLAFPIYHGEAFGEGKYLSTFARSGVEAVSAYMEHGFLDAAPAGGVGERLTPGPYEACHVAGKQPHILLLHDESSFDIRAINGVKVPDGYGGHFRSFDGKERKFLVEGAGGPSWYTEYNVLAGLSSRSYGRFQFFVTRIAAGRVQRGLPQALKRCGYRTSAIYPVFGGFLGTASFYKGAGIDTIVDGKDLGSGVFEPDSFYFGQALRRIAQERERGPMFLYVYTTANHFTWDYPLRADLTPDGWRSPGNPKPEVNEFLRRQAMSERDYKDFYARLKRDFPGESFLIVRYGDHQPDFAKIIIEPTIDDWELGNRILGYDPRYYTTYYAIDTINFTPVDLSSALDTLDAPYLPLVVQDAAGVPLDPSFAEQKKILARCKGLFYDCAGGAEARRFNRMLMDAGLIKGL
jgi:hypothetical protein